MRKILSVCLGLCLIVTVVFVIPARAFTVEEAYQAIPHRRTVFDPSSATMSDKEKNALVQFFNVTDLAVAKRVEEMLWLQGNHSIQSANTYDEILNQIDALDLPEKLNPVRKLFRDAIVDQKDFLQEWRTSGHTSIDVAGDAKVQRASQKLQQAYGLIMQLYPNENEHNKAAFFDYPCALDFL